MKISKLIILLFVSLTLSSGVWADSDDDNDSSNNRSSQSRDDNDDSSRSSRKDPCVTHVSGRDGYACLPSSRPANCSERAWREVQDHSGLRSCH
ncbi:hypothetical protein BH10PSE19_BH10PSE19_20250 [soil metagenome]